MPYAMTVTTVRASLTTAQTAGTLLTVDINDSGRQHSFNQDHFRQQREDHDDCEQLLRSSATTALADDAEITVDIDVVGTSGAEGLKVTLLGTR